MKPAPHCYNLPPHVPFLHELAKWLLAEYGQDNRQFTKILLLLPSRRACKSMREVFLEVTGGKPLLLPRIQPIGEVEGEELFLAPTDNIAQPIPPVRRHLMLMQLVLRFQRGQGGTMEQAAQLARELARFLDDVARQKLDFKSLESLAPEHLAGHWQQTVDFLGIISRAWPLLLQQEGLMDPVAHRNLALSYIAGQWQQNPPNHPIIAAGSTGSQPATAQLLKTIAHLPQGAVILPGLDMAMPEKEWQLLGETHPQYGLKKLLTSIEVEREKVALISAQPAQAGEWLRAVFAPPAITASWKTAQLPPAPTHISTAEADTLLDEAKTIAIALRETLEMPGKTAALVTPDRRLARMVIAQLQRFGITIDDSAGKPLAASTPGCFLRLAAEMVASHAAPAALLALLRHPLAAGGREPAECRRLSRVLELELLRGIRHASGLEGLRDDATDPALKIFLSELAERSAELTELFKPHSNASLKSLLSAHMAFAEWLASTNDENGAKRLWAGEAGNALANYIAELYTEAELLPALDAYIYPGLFDALLSGEIYRQQFGLHPRLHILSPIEARLLRFDKIILAGLNENSWPASPQADPWMSRPMREAFGLPPAEQDIGRSAHDVFMFMHAPDVLLTRARKIDGAPSVPSRWWVRFKTLAKGRAPQDWQRMQREEIYASGRQLLDQPAAMPQLAPPAPTPPVSARPRKLRVTAIDQWLRDPYIIYAKYILRLRKLEALDREPDAADFGNLVHAALERFTQQYPAALPADAQEELLRCGREAFAGFLSRPAVARLWWPRFESMASWLADIEQARRGSITSVMSEVNSSWALGDFTLTTRIDRLERHNDNMLSLIDYKTGAIPTKADIQRGLANQLPLEALTLLQGEIAPVQLEYWKLAGDEAKCSITPVEADLAQARERLENLIRHFDQPQTPYAAQENPALHVRYNDYEHLTRRKEWETL